MGNHHTLLQAQGFYHSSYLASKRVKRDVEDEIKPHFVSHCLDRLNVCEEFYDSDEVDVCNNHQQSKKKS